MTEGVKEKKLVNQPYHPVPKPQPKKGSIAGATNGYLRAHTSMRNGKKYYYYCRGTDPEIYLGTAEAILRKVKRI